MAEVTGGEVEPLGVDGCGVPAFRSSVLGLARAYARLAVDPGLAEVATAMKRFAPLTSDGDRPEACLARWTPSAVKGGWQGCLGVAWSGGLGIAAKCWSGLIEPAAVAVVEMMRRVRILPDHQHAMLSGVACPGVIGGDREVGRMAPLEEVSG
jgi:L-asparaginase II